jgi:DMSO/TMAO reductase YedYZ molybdopterin-dependent catalytic subunit
LNGETAPLLKLEGVTDADVLDEAAVPDEAGAVVVDTADTTDTVPVLVLARETP